MQKKFQLFEDTLKKLDSAGALKDIVLIGSWCLPIYSEMYGNPSEFPALRTKDLDFFIPNARQASKVDVHALLLEMGYEATFDRFDEYIKYDHDELEVEFLGPRNRDGKKVSSVDALNVKVQALNYLDRVKYYLMKGSYKGIEIQVPELPAFLLQKAVIYPQRLDDDKKLKDSQAIEGLGEFVSEHESLRVRTIEIYNSFPKSWRKTALKVLEEFSPEVYEFLV